MSDGAGHRCGTVAVLGRPNVGKSTLVNALVGERLSIVSPKPQTTRHRILGVVQREHAQLMLVDTPGLHRDRSGRAMNRVMNRTANQALEGVEAVLVLVDATRVVDEDRDVIALASGSGVPALLALNKIDRVRPKEGLLPLLAELGATADWRAVVPVSALKGDGLPALEAELTALMPEGPPAWPGDSYTDRSTNFLIGERIREQAMLLLQDELPYALTVEVQRVADEAGRLVINADLVVERESHKGMVIGKGGAMLERIGSRARKGIAGMLGTKVHLELWVKVREGWSADERALRQLGVDET